MGCDTGMLSASAQAAMQVLCMTEYTSHGAATEGRGQEGKLLKSLQPLHTVGCRGNVFVF